MKVQIRRSVFETNSSSTHSLQITKGGVDAAKSDIINNKFDIRNVKYKSCISGETFKVHGLDCDTGGEASDVYTIITNWEAKLQYLASYFYGIFDEYDEGENDDITRFKNVFRDCVIKLCAEHGVTITNVVFDKVCTSWIEETNYPKDFEVSDDFENDEDIADFIYKVMNDEYTVTFCSEAYSPYEGCSINVIA